MKNEIDSKAPFLEYKEILVTGGTGFVGQRVCRALIARGWLPRLLVRSGSEGKIPLDVRRQCRISLGDITDRESVINAAQSTDAIVNLVGVIREFPSKGITFEKLHVEGTRNVIAAAKVWKISRIVHMSALGALAGSPVPYFDTKGRAEQLVRESGLEWTLFRPSIVFGEGDKFISMLSKVVRRAPAIPVPGDGRYELQPVWVGDVARGFALALTKPEAIGHSFDVGGLERFSYNALLDGIGASVGRSHVRKMHVPLPLVRTGVRFMSRFEWYPASPDMLAMLTAGSVCETAGFRSVFEDHLVSLREYLSCSAHGDIGKETLKAPETPEEPADGKVRSAA